jgi:hypothetical protein
LQWGLAVCVYGATECAADSSRVKLVGGWCVSTALPALLSCGGVGVGADEWV